MVPRSPEKNDLTTDDTDSTDSDGPGIEVNRGKDYRPMKLNAAHRRRSQFIRAIRAIRGSFRPLSRCKNPSEKVTRILAAKSFEARESSVANRDPAHAAI